MGVRLDGAVRGAAPRAPAGRQLAAEGGPGGGGEGPGLRAEILLQRRAGKLSTGPFMKPWAASLPHLADFAAGERAEFLRLMPDEARAAAERAWREEADVVRRRLAAVERRSAGIEGPGGPGRAKAFFIAGGAAS